MIIRLIYQINKLLQTKKQAKIIKFKAYKIALLTQKTTAFSFLNTIYINQNLYESNRIDESIIIHELAHINQKHSYDIILIEILKALFWLNPALYFYKLAISTNHEFLADDNVLKSKPIKDYQQVIFNELVNNISPLVYTFKRYNNTKKRFIMMKTNQKRSTTRILGSIFFSGAIIFAFAEKVKTPILLEKQEQRTLTQQNPRTISKKEIIADSKVESQTKLSTYINKEQASDTIIIKGNSNSNQVDLQAQFPGGVNALRSLLSEDFDPSKFKNIFGIITANLLLKIDKNGKIQEIKIKGIDDTLAKEFQERIKNYKKDLTWVPAQKNGKAVASELNITLTIEFTGDGSTPPPSPPPPIPHHASKIAKN